MNRRAEYLKLYANIYLCKALSHYPQHFEMESSNWQSHHCHRTVDLNERIINYNWVRILIYPQPCWSVYSIQFSIGSAHNAIHNKQINSFSSFQIACKFSLLNIYKELFFPHQSLMVSPCSESMNWPLTTFRRWQHHSLTKTATNHPKAVLSFSHFPDYFLLFIRLPLPLYSVIFCVVISLTSEHSSVNCMRPFVETQSPLVIWCTVHRPVCVGRVLYQLCTFVCLFVECVLYSLPYFASLFTSFFTDP